MTKKLEDNLFITFIFIAGIVIGFLFGIITYYSADSVRMDYDKDTYIVSFYDNSGNIISPYLSEKGNYMVYIGDNKYVEMTHEEWETYYNIKKRGEK